ncbi:MAG: hypothetical protein MUE51_06580 [Thermoleophilia bacterium]|jgi:hypothetical protein|nr:hypothetical protein [Thermoleophilia bacterium]
MPTAAPPPVAPGLVVHGHLTRAACGGGQVVVHGDLVVAGGIGAGVGVRATGDVRVDGPVECAEVVAGGAVLLGAGASGADIRAGVAAAPAGALGRLAGRAPGPLEAAAASAEGLAAAARALGLALVPAEAFRLAVAARHRDLPGRLAGAEVALLRAQEHLPELHPGILAAVRSLLAVLDGEAPAVAPAALARDLAACIGGPGAGRRPGRVVVAPELVGCRVHTGGHVRLTGAGARDGEIRAGGDLMAAAPGGRVAGGSHEVGGRLVCALLGGRGRTEVRLLGHPHDERPLDHEADRVRTARVGEGVVVRAWAGAIGLDPARDGAAVYVARGRPLVRRSPASRR